MVLISSICPSSGLRPLQAVRCQYSCSWISGGFLVVDNRILNFMGGELEAVPNPGQILRVTGAGSGTPELVLDDVTVVVKTLGGTPPPLLGRLNCFRWLRSTGFVSGPFLRAKRNGAFVAVSPTRGRAFLAPHRFRMPCVACFRSPRTPLTAV